MGMGWSSEGWWERVGVGRVRVGGVIGEGWK